MKLRAIFNMLGFRSRPKTYGWRIDSFDVGASEPLRFAQWLHPKYRPTRFDAGQIACLRRYLNPGDAVLDIGAHGGDTSVLFAHAVGPAGRVFAAEPNRYVLPVLEENTRLNPAAAPITILPYAAVETPGPLTFNYSDAGFCNGGDLGQIAATRHGHFYPLRVEGRNMLAELSATAPEWMPRIRLVKSDTEGHDADVIASLKPFILRQKPFLVCEIYRHMDEGARRAFFHLLTAELGYRVFLAEPWHTLQVEELSAEELMHWQHYDIFCMPSK
ncbi:MAG: FkbM family methyltransferase [Flavobacteriaceae bacterium]